MQPSSCLKPLDTFRLSGELLPRIERILARHREPVVAYIRANLHKIHFREEVAHHLQISPGTVSNQLRRYAGQPFSNFLRDCRIREAQRLLAETGLDVHQVAIRVGFKSRQALDRAFRHATGSSPHQYRKGSRPK